MKPPGFILWNIIETNLNLIRLWFIFEKKFICKLFAKANEIPLDITIINNLKCAYFIICDSGRARKWLIKLY